MPYADDQLIRQAICPTFSTKTAHTGLPPLEARQRSISRFEFWPSALIYLPIAVYWIVRGIRHGSLTLPLSANPGLFLGGLVGEAKSDSFRQAGPYARQHIAPWVAIENKQNNLAATLEHATGVMAAKQLSFPLVAKPDVGCRGQGVQIVRTPEQLHSYLACFPDAATVLLQELVPWEAEAGVFYIRQPGQPRGRIFSLTLKYQPYVFGNGKDTLRTLIERDPRAGQLTHLYFERHRSSLDTVLAHGQPFRLAFAGSHSRGAIFRSGQHFITEDLCRTFDALCDDIKGFYFGRFDVRFKDMESFQKGRDFKVLEINGISSEAAHIWDAHSSLRMCYRTLFAQYRELFGVALANRSHGHVSGSLASIVKAWWKERRLTALYPETE